MPKKKTTAEPTIIETIDTVITTGNEQLTHTDAKVVLVDSVVDWKLVKVEWYVTDTPINDTSKLIRYQEDGKHPENKFFTKK